MEPGVVGPAQGGEGAARGDVARFLVADDLQGRCRGRPARAVAGTGCCAPPRVAPGRVAGYQSVSSGSLLIVGEGRRFLRLRRGHAGPLMERTVGVCAVWPVRATPDGCRRHTG